MTVELQQTFDEFARGVISPETFQHELLTLCKTTPDQAWEALALLDQHFRRGKIPAELQQSLRHRIQRQALGIESYQPQRARAIPVAPDADAEEPTIETAPPQASATTAAVPVPVPVRLPETVLTPEPATIAPGSARLPALALERAPMLVTTVRVRQPSRVVAASARWRPYFRVSPAIALSAVMLAVAASPTVKEGQDNLLAIERGVSGAGAANATGNEPGAESSPSQAEQGPQMLTLSSDSYTIDPGSGVAELSVERSPDASGDASFLWWTEGSGAKPDQDYMADKPRRVEMADGVRSSTLRIRILSNPNRRHIEMFYVLIGRPMGNAAVGPIHRAAIFLLPQHAR
jgi:hypothetical protein